MDNALINTTATHETRNEPQEGVPKTMRQPGARWVVRTIDRYQPGVSAGPNCSGPLSHPCVFDRVAGRGSGNAGCWDRPAVHPFAGFRGHHTQNGDFLRCGGQARTVSPVDVTAVRGSQLTYCIEVAAELLADVEEQPVRSVHQAQRPGRESPPAGNSSRLFRETLGFHQENP